MSAARVRGLPPVVGTHVHTLILGSMPGVASIEAQEYYGHSRNAFWDVAEELGIARELPYPTRCEKLGELGFALWDVLHQCDRDGSLDQDIRNGVANDVIGFAADLPGLVRVWFNGQAAARHFERALGAAFRAAHPSAELRTMPSTSPAHTDRSKYALWRGALREAARDAHARA